LVGNIRGVVDLDNVITGVNIKPGDTLVGVSSSGLHTNGFSMVNRVFFGDKKYSLTGQVPFSGKSLGEELLTPHRNYTKPLTELFSKKVIKGIAHITGGGLPGNVVRILPEHVQAKIKLGSWETLPIFLHIQKEGGIEDNEMRRTFNMGVGLVLVCELEKSKEIRQVFEKYGMRTFEIGSVEEGERGVIFE